MNIAMQPYSVTFKASLIHSNVHVDIFPLEDLLLEQLRVDCVQQLAENSPMCEALFRAQCICYILICESISAHQCRHPSLQEVNEIDSKIEVATMYSYLIYSIYCAIVYYPLIQHACVMICPVVCVYISFR